MRYNGVNLFTLLLSAIERFSVLNVTLEKKKNLNKTNNVTFLYCILHDIQNAWENNHENIELCLKLSKQKEIDKQLTFFASVKLQSDDHPTVPTLRFDSNIPSNKRGLEIMLYHRVSIVISCHDFA